MKHIFNDINDELFSVLLIKEQELKYWQNLYKKQNISNIKKYFIVLNLLKNLLFKSNESTLIYNKDNSINKIIRYKCIKLKKFKVHIIMRRKLEEININKVNLIKYQVYALIEYVSDGTVTKNKYFFRSFCNYNRACSNFNRLYNKFCKKNIRMIIKNLIKSIDKECLKIKKHI